MKIALMLCAIALAALTQVTITPPPEASLSADGARVESNAADADIAAPADAAEVPTDDAAEPVEVPWDDKSVYAKQKIEGWTVLVHPDVLAAEPLAEAVLAEMEHQLYKVRRRLPEAAVEKLRTVPIWIELTAPHGNGACFHPDANWLHTHGYNPVKQGAVEVSNAKNFVTWTHDQPFVMLHELSHAWHFHFLEDGYANAALEDAYAQAVASKKYEQVLRISGHTEQHYALNNAKEYFAEACEAYFGTNDYYPFVRSELKVHDPVIYALMDELWNSEETEGE